MNVETDKGGALPLPLADILTSEEPVWVWDAEARRILWANRAGRAFWGAQTLESLRARKFDSRNKTLSRMANLAQQTGHSREWTESLTLPGRGNRAPVTCYMQTMQVAGGRPGLIVRALDAFPPRDDAAKESAGQTIDAQTPQDSVALRHIAARLKQRQNNGRGHKAAGAITSAADASGDMGAQAIHTALVRELCHELSNPLAAILGFAERIRDADPARPEIAVRAYAENILEGARFALDILGDFSARFRQDAPPPSPKPTDVSAAIGSCLRLIAPLAAQAGIKVSKSLGRKLPHLRIEERALKQAVLNMLVNAVRHQKTGVRVEVLARMQRDRSLLLTVKDDGVGMTKKEIKAALGRKGRQQTPRTDGKSGLGLPLIKRLVESAGGSVSIESARGKGASVAMRFPPACLISPLQSDKGAALNGAAPRAREKG